MPQRIFLAGNVDAVKESVFDTSSLPQVRVGSNLLLECEEEIRGSLQRRFNYEIIGCGGGYFLLDAPVDRAQRI